MHCNGEHLVEAANFSQTRRDSQKSGWRLAFSKSPGCRNLTEEVKQSSTTACGKFAEPSSPTVLRHAHTHSSTTPTTHCNQLHPSGDPDITSKQHVYPQNHSPSDVRMTPAVKVIAMSCWRYAGVRICSKSSWKRTLSGWARIEDPGCGISASPSSPKRIAS